MMPQRLSPFMPGASGAVVVPGLATVGGGELSCARAVEAKAITSAPVVSSRAFRIPEIPSVVFMTSSCLLFVPSPSKPTERDENKTAPPSQVNFRRQMMPPPDTNGVLLKNQRDPAPRPRRAPSSLEPPAGLAAISQPVSHAWLRRQELGASGVRLDLAPQLSHVDAEVLNLFAVAPAPDLLEDLTLREHASAVLREQQQETKLDRCQMYLAPSEGYFSPSHVDAELTDLEGRRRCRR